jgi:phosphate starvation-inducible membrane PsiE
MLTLNLNINIFQIIGQPIFSNNYRFPKLFKLYLNITEIIMLTIIDLLNRMKKKLAENKCFCILTIVPLS